MRNIYTCTWCSSWSMKISFLVLWDFEHGTKALKTPHCRLQWQQLLKRIQCLSNTILCLSNTILSVNLNNVIISSGNNKSRLLFEAINSCTFWISSKPLKFLSPQDEVTGNVNVEFLDWEEQYQLLVSWFLSSMTEGILTRMVGCESASQIWTKLNLYFAAPNQSKSLTTQEHALEHQEKFTAYSMKIC